MSDPPADRALTRLADVIADQQEREREQANRVAELAATVDMYQERSVNLAAQLDATERRAALAHGRLAALESGAISPPVTVAPSMNGTGPSTSADRPSPAADASAPDRNDLTHSVRNTDLSGHCRASL